MALKQALKTLQSCIIVRRGVQIAIWNNAVPPKEPIDTWKNII